MLLLEDARRSALCQLGAGCCRNDPKQSHKVLLTARLIGDKIQISSSIDTVTYCIGSSIKYDGDHQTSS